MRTLDIAITHPEAYEALPAPYRADDCLVFFIQDGVLWASPDADQIEALGDWESFYKPGIGWMGI